MKHGIDIRDSAGIECQCGEAFLGIVEYNKHVNSYAELGDEVRRYADLYGTVAVRRTPEGVYEALDPYRFPVMLRDAGLVPATPDQKLAAGLPGGDPFKELPYFQTPLRNRLIDED